MNVLVEEMTNACEVALEFVKCMHTIFKEN